MVTYADMIIIMQFVDFENLPAWEWKYIEIAWKEYTNVF